MLWRRLEGNQGGLQLRRPCQGSDSNLATDHTHRIPSALLQLLHSIPVDHSLVDDLLRGSAIAHERHSDDDPSPDHVA